MVKAIIFDVDGVLLDTVPYHYKAWKKLFKEQNIKFTFADYLLKVNGIPRKNGLKNIIPHLEEKELEILSQKKQDYFLELVTKYPPPPLPGVIPILKIFKKKGIKLAAASSSKNVSLLLKRSGLTIYLSAIISGNDFKKPKPDPELFILASKRIKVKPSECAVIEDAAIGIEAAKNGKMQTIGILTSNDKLIKNIADLTIKSFLEKDKILEFILRI